MSGMILNQSQPKFAAHAVANEMQPVQETGLLIFESKSTATSKGYVQMLGNNIWYDSESIATKVCIQISCR